MLIDYGLIALAVAIFLMELIAHRRLSERIAHLEGEVATWMRVSRRRADDDA